MNKRSVKALIAIASIITLTSFGVIACDKTEDTGISMLIGQGNDGDYNGGSKLKFMSYNLGSTWKFVGEIKK